MPDERVDLAQRQGRRGPAVEVAPEEAVGGHAELERGVGGLFGDGGTVLPGEGEDAEDATDAGGAVVTVDVVADGGDGGAGPLGGGEQGMAGFAGREERRPRPRTVRPAAFR